MTRNLFFSIRNFPVLPEWPPGQADYHLNQDQSEGKNKEEAVSQGKIKGKKNRGQKYEGDFPKTEGSFLLCAYHQETQQGKGAMSPSQADYQEREKKASGKMTSGVSFFRNQTITQKTRLSPTRMIWKGRSFFSLPNNNAVTSEERKMARIVQ